MKKDEKRWGKRKEGKRIRNKVEENVIFRQL
jgi:hypothetical protein